MKLNAYLCYFCLAALALTGCATGNISTDPSARLAVTYATLKVIESGPDSEVRAAKIRDIASEARQFIETDALSLDQLSSALRARIAHEGLNPSDQLLADALILTVMSELEARVGSGLLSPEQKLTVGAVLGWVIVAAGG